MTVPAAPGDWRPTATWETLATRARLLARARRYFAEAGLVEVETPALVTHGVTDVHLANPRVELRGPPRREVFLHTSPEFHMKRLLAAGAPDIYQLCKVFRDGERGRHHEPEFTLLEWYRRGLGLEGMADDAVGLIRALAAEAGSDPGAARSVTYQAIFRQHTGLDPLEAGGDALRRRARELLGESLPAGLSDSLGTEAGPWQDLLFSHVVQPGLAGTGLQVVLRFPAEQAALARLTPGDPRTAERFEVFWGGLELANGYHELSDSAEQGRRFAADGEARRRLGMQAGAPDPRLLAALAAGLPDCAGVALGFDRLVMAVLGLATLREAISFPAPEG